jgi:hypothetical protein
MSEAPIQRPIPENAEKDINEDYLEAGTAISSRIDQEGRRAFTDGAYEALPNKTKEAIESLLSAAFAVPNGAPEHPMRLPVKDGLTVGLNLAQRMLEPSELERVEEAFRTDLGQVTGFMDRQGQDYTISGYLARTAGPFAEKLKAVLPTNIFAGAGGGGFVEAQQSMDQAYGNALAYAAMHADNQMAETAIRDGNQLSMTEELTMVAEDLENRARTESAP